MELLWIDGIHFEENEFRLEKIVDNFYENNFEEFTSKKLLNSKIKINGYLNSSVIYGYSFGDGVLPDFSLFYEIDDENLIVKSFYGLSDSIEYLNHILFVQLSKYNLVIRKNETPKIFDYISEKHSDYDKLVLNEYECFIRKWNE